nr:hypothetical protein [Tanacetum cinerariifolium]
MLLKQKDPMVLEKKVNTKPIDYATLNQLSKYFATRFVPQSGLSTEHVSCPSSDPIPSKLLKVSMYLIDELAKVQNDFHQMKQDVDQHRLESKTFGFQNERLLEQVISRDIMNIVVNASVNNDFVSMSKCKKCLKFENELLKKQDFITKEKYDKLLSSYAPLEKHCISLEVDTQLNQEIFKRDHSILNQSAPSFNEYFELNKLKAQSQEKDTVIKKLKERVKSLSGNMDNDKVKKDIDEIEMINIELKHRVSKLEQVLVITTLKEELKKLKRKVVVENAVTSPTIALKMYEIDVQPIAFRLLHNRMVHSKYLKYTEEQAMTLREIVEQRKSKNLLNSSLDYALAVNPKNKDKKVRFFESATSSGNKNTKPDSSSNIVSNKSLFSSTGVNITTSASGSQRTGSTKKDKITQTPSRSQKNKVEAHTRNVNSSLNKKIYVVKSKGIATVQQSKLNMNSDVTCGKCNGCMLSSNHDLCALNVTNDVNARSKSKSVKKNSKRKVWKPIGKVFNKTRYIWRPTGRTIYIVRNTCPLTRITKTTKVPLRKPIALEIDTPKPIVTLVYSRKPRRFKTGVPTSKPKINKSMTANSKEPSKSKESKVSNVPSSSLDEFRSSKLFSDCATGKSKKKTDKRKSEDTNQEKLYLLHMDPCGLIRVASINGKKYILVIVDDYSRFTWVKCLRSKDEAPYFIIKFLKMIQNGVVEGRNRTLIEAARIIKTPYEILHNKLPDLSFLHVFGALCYSTNDSKNLGKLQPKADIEDDHDLDVAHMSNDPFFGIPILEKDSESSSTDVIHTVVHTATPNSDTSQNRLRIILWIT